MPVSAIIQIGLALLPSITTGVEEFIAWLNKSKTAAQQANDWTPEQDAAFNAALWAKTQDPAYQPDKP